MLIEDIEYVIFRHPDLSAARNFMIDFGLLDAGQKGKALYLRTYGDAPFSFVTTEGDAALVGMGFRVSNHSNLLDLAVRFGANIEDSPHPGGGKYLHTTDPEGRRLEFSISSRRSLAMPSGRVKRLGHLAIFSPASQKMIDWYCKHLNMRVSELIHDGEDTNVIASFLRLDKGPILTDHHTLAIVQAPALGLDHVAFECGDRNKSGFGLMQNKAHHHRCGIGIQSQKNHIFDYQADPVGFHFEHYYDGELVNQDTPTLCYGFNRDNMFRWGPPAH